MDTQSYSNQFNNLDFVQQPVTVGQGMTSQIMPLAPQLIQHPIMAPPLVPMTEFVPQPLLIPFINVYQNVPGDTDILICTPNGLESGTAADYCPSKSLDGNHLAPQGWSFMPKDEFIKYGLNMCPFPTSVNVLTPVRHETPVPSPTLTPSRSPSQEPSVPSTQDVIGEKVTSVQKPVAKRPHRAKQMKITKVHTAVKENCVRKNIFADEKEVLRGPDVLRIHVKTWEGLDLIQEVLDEVESAVDIARVALPFSMKNKFQKKGFICYLMVQSEESVSIVQEIFGQYPEAFKKCDVALPTIRDPVLEEGKAETKHFVMPADFGMAPPTFSKRLSAA